MSDQSMVEMQQRGEAAEAAIKAAIASERRRCIDRVLTYAALIRPYPSNRRKQRRWATCSENGQGMTSSNTPAIALNHPDTQLLMRILDRLAQDPGIPWSQARQAVLWGFWDTLSTR